MEALYAVLGLHSDATEGEVKSRYRRLVLELHPDKHPGDKGKEELFRSVTFAYQTITDEDKRAAFMQGRSGSSHLGPLVEREQQRAADNVYVAAMHFLFCDDDKRRQGLAAHYVPDFEKEKVVDVLCANFYATITSWYEDVSPLSLTDVASVIRDGWPHLLVIVLVWLGLRFVSMFSSA
ncbi:DNA-J chaperone, putative [Bodo saltans]|uniref:DNA-J chaperone, putative n=1 Tax=Bodo saltans TaxID=75058 RepID=A0A0S4JQ22_BODSA|nr:DNA-J chaperone, putative [Bodo saltans]|eukprot:CUG92268.1 DNA-J chaperone, putative [Bodo saltans]